MPLQAAELAWIAAAGSFTAWALAAVLLGAGTAMCIPPCSPPSATSPTPAWRARAVGVYRLWRDGGFAVSAVLDRRFRDGAKRSPPDNAGFGGVSAC
jgi:hypothetical protein